MVICRLQAPRLVGFLNRGADHREQSLDSRDDRWCTEQDERGRAEVLIGTTCVAFDRLRSHRGTLMRAQGRLDRLRGHHRRAQFGGHFKRYRYLRHVHLRVRQTTPYWRVQTRTSTERFAKCRGELGLANEP